MQISKSLIETYNKPTPRYTSYPPANYFTNSFLNNDYLQLIEKSNTEQPEHISFYVHIPFCNQICYYCGCNSIADTNTKHIEKYVAALKKEINIVLKLLDKNRKISQIHYGGGTPNSIDIRYLKEINQLFLSNFKTIDKPEIAIECHPGILTHSDVEQLIDAGFNRFSLGVQDFNNDILKNVNRKPSIIPIADLVRQLKENERVTGINLDFIYGLPGQTPSSFAKTIEQAISIKPNRLVTFSYAHVPWVKKYQTKLSEIGLPSPDDKTKMFLLAYNLLLKSEYIAIGFDHYALPNDELSIALANKQLHRNFQGYTTRRTTGQVYAFGVSAISQLNGGYAQNTKSIKKYIQLIEQQKLPIEQGIKLSDNQIVIGKIITDIMCNKYINWQKTADLLGLSVNGVKKIINYNNENLKTFALHKLLKFTENELEVTEIGSFFIRNIASSFDPLFADSENMYSKSV